MYMYVCTCIHTYTYLSANKMRRLKLVVESMYICMYVTYTCIHKYMYAHTLIAVCTGTGVFVYYYFIRLWLSFSLLELRFILFYATWQRLFYDIAYKGTHTVSHEQIRLCAPVCESERKSVSGELSAALMLKFSC